jgi:hypothetical protein
MRRLAKKAVLPLMSGLMCRNTDLRGPAAGVKVAAVAKADLAAAIGPSASL